MKLQTLVPTMGLIAAAGSAQAFDLASTAEGKLHVTGYVDAVLEFSMFQQNAPRHGDYDNQALWDTQLRTANGGVITYSGGGIGYEIYAGSGARFYEPQSSYFGTGSSATLGSMLIITPGGVAVGSPSSTALASGVTPVTGVNTAGQAPLNYAIVPGMTIGPGTIGYTIPFANFNGRNDSILDFKTTAEIGVGWDVNENVDAVIELELTDGNNVAVEQAYIDWRFPEQMLELQAGKYDNWIGWEATDPTGLYRVNTSLVAQMSGNGQVTGLGATLNPINRDDLQLAFSADLVDSLYGDPYGLKDGNDLALGLGAEVCINQMVTMAASLNIDFNATYDDGVLRQAWDENIYLPALVPGFPAGFGVPVSLWAAGDFREHVLGANFQIEIDPDGADQGLLFAADLHAVDYDLAMARGLMAMVNYRLPDDKVAFPMAFTAMASYLDPNDEDAEINTVMVNAGGGVFNINDYIIYNGEDDEEMELALAFLSNPTGSPNFALNAELRYIVRPDYEIPPGGSGMGTIEVTNRNEIGVFLELLAILP